MKDGDSVEMVFLTCDFKRVGEKNTPLCELRGETTADGEVMTSAIWLTEKAAGIARQQFKRIGFDIDKHPLSRLAEYLKAKRPTTMVTVESYEVRDSLLYRGVIEVGSAGGGLPKEALDTFTRFMRSAKKDNEEPVAEAKSAPQRAAPPKSDVNFDDIPFAFLISTLTLVGGALFA